jgi:hypothetical protein
MYWPVEDVIMKFLPLGSEGRMGKCCWHKRPGCINSCAALILKNPFCLYGLLDIFSGFEEFMEE